MGDDLGLFLGHLIPCFFYTELAFKFNLFKVFQVSRIPKNTKRWPRFKIFYLELKKEREKR